MGWPNTLAEKLGIQEVVNKSIPGASNKKIWKTVVDFGYHQDDIVIVNWSFITRTTYFRENSDDVFILPRYSEYEWYYENLYSEYDGLIDLNLRADHIHRYLWSKDVNNFHALLSISNITSKSVGNWMSFEFLKSDFDSIRLKYPPALDGSHPNKDAHDEYALCLFNELNGKI
jgi:hypothetical protein